MTILYKPVLIETAEQAEALPVGTFVVRANGRLPKKRKDGTWGDLWGDCGLFDILTRTAYVPIEAEEERIKDYFFDRPGWMSRLVTPWEEA